MDELDNHRARKVIAGTKQNREQNKIDDSDPTVVNSTWRSILQSALRPVLLLWISGLAVNSHRRGFLRQLWNFRTIVDEMATTRGIGEANGNNKSLKQLRMWLYAGEANEVPSKSLGRKVETDIHRTVDVSHDAVQHTAPPRMEVMLTDLGDKVPWLCPVLRPEYTPYFNTAGTVLLGWMVVCWISHIVWNLFAPLTISTIAIIIVCPNTAKWIIKRLGPNVENALRNFLTKVQSSMPDVR